MVYLRTRMKYCLLRHVLHNAKENQRLAEEIAYALVESCLPLCPQHPALF